MPDELIKFIIQQDFETSNSGVALKILGVAPKAGEKGVALKVGEKAARISLLCTHGSLYSRQTKTLKIEYRYFCDPLYKAQYWYGTARFGTGVSTLALGQRTVLQATRQGSPRTRSLTATWLTFCLFLRV